MKWPRKFSTGSRQAAQRLADLEQRQNKVEAGIVQFRQENGFIRMVRESMGPAR